MKLNITKFPAEINPNFKGGDGVLITRMFSDEKNKILYATLPPKSSVGEHRHETSSEIIYILSGTSTCICDGERESLAPGVCHYCPMGSTHTIINNSTEDLVFIAVVPEH